MYTYKFSQFIQYNDVIKLLYKYSIIILKYTSGYSYYEILIQLVKYNCMPLFGKN